MQKCVLQLLGEIEMDLQFVAVFIREMSAMYVICRQALCLTGADASLLDAQHLKASNVRLMSGSVLL